MERQYSLGSWNSHTQPCKLGTVPWRLPCKQPKAGDGHVGDGRETPPPPQGLVALSAGRESQGTEPMPASETQGVAPRPLLHQAHLLVGESQSHAEELVSGVWKITRRTAETVGRGAAKPGSLDGRRPGPGAGWAALRRDRARGRRWEAGVPVPILRARCSLLLLRPGGCEHLGAVESEP